MSQEKDLLARGAETVTGDLILNRKTVGRYRNGEFHITEDGLAELEVIEVVAKTVDKPAKAEKPVKTPKTPKPEPLPDPVAPDVDDLDSLLGAE